MVKFKQKKFAAPVVAAGGMGLMNALTAGSLGLGVLQMGQASKQAKEAGKQQEEALAVQKQENAKLTKALNNIAKEAKNNPQAALQAGYMAGESRMFAVPVAAKGVTTLGKGFLKNLKGFAKEAVSAVGSGKNIKVKSGKKIVDKSGRTGFFNKGRTVNLHKYEKDSTGLSKVGKTLIGLGTAGVIGTGVSYGVDKAITLDARKQGIMLSRDNSDAQQKSYAIPSSVMSKTGNLLKKGVKYTFSKKNLLNSDVKFMAAFGAVPALGYLAQRSQHKQQIKNQESTQSPVNNVQQKSYAAPVVARSVAKSGRKIFKNWDGMKTITGGAARLGSFGMYGKREIQAYGQRLAKGNHAWSKKTGKWIQDNPNKANLAGVAIGLGTINAVWKGSENLTKKALKKVDKDAFAYEKHQNQEVQ